MTKSALWDHIVSRNPGFNSSPVSFSAAGVRKLFDLAYDQGHAEGVVNGRALERDDVNREKKANPLAGVFGW